MHSDIASALRLRFLDAPLWTFFGNTANKRFCFFRIMCVWYVQLVTSITVQYDVQQLNKLPRTNFEGILTLVSLINTLYCNRTTSVLSLILKTPLKCLKTAFENRLHVIIFMFLLILLLVGIPCSN